MKFSKPSWMKIKKMCKALAKKVSLFKPDWIIGVSRGGLVPARLLSDYLNIFNISIIRIEFYKTITETKDFPTISQPLQVNVKGKKVLIVDDVVDTGRSLVVAKEHVKRAGALEAKIAVLHFKPKSVIKPDFYIESTNAWIIYPWELEETKRERKKLKGKI